MMKVAVMGCIVNGPGESQEADIGISLPAAGSRRLRRSLWTAPRLRALRATQWPGNLNR